LARNWRKTTTWNDRKHLFFIWLLQVWRFMRVCGVSVCVCGRPARLWTAGVVVVFAAAAGEFLFKRFQIAQRMKTKEKMKHIESEHITKR